MEQFTFDTDAQFKKALAIVKKTGVDFEADPKARTIVTDELSSTEYKRICAVYQS